MRPYVTLVVTPHDHPVLDTYEDDEGETQVTVHLDETVSILGSKAEVVRWTQELALKVAEL